MTSTGSWDKAAWERLEQNLLDAHRRNDIPVLIGGYTQAAEMLDEGGNTDAACFYFTQAYVLAVEVGSPEAGALDRRLIAHGRNREASRCA